MIRIKKIDEMFSINEGMKSLKEILIELAQKCDTGEINTRNVIMVLQQEITADMSNSSEPVRIKGDVPYLDYESTRWIATYKYNGVNYKVSFTDDSNTHYKMGSKWYYFNGGKCGLQINDSTDDFEDESMKVYVDKYGNVQKLNMGNTDRKSIDMEATVVYLLKQWVRLQNL